MLDVTSLKTPYDEFPTCQICGGSPESSCVCQECPVCGEAGNPKCVNDHMPVEFWKSTAAMGEIPAGKVAIQIKVKGYNGRPVFEVPVVMRGKERGPRCPVGGGSFYYTPDGERCVVLASKGATSYLMQRRYAHYLGIAQHSPHGIGHFEWQPEKTGATQ